MGNNNIKFGTDGWRAIIDKEFTPANIIRVVQGFCEFHKDSEDKTVYIGYDRRKKSDVSAKLVAHFLAHNGFQVYLSETFCPTPCISWVVHNESALAGIVVTASHNPSEWNGIKFKESYGGSASPEYIAAVERNIPDADFPCPHLTSFCELKDSGKIAYFKTEDTYVKHLQDFIDIEAIQKADYRVGFDPLFGAGSGYLNKVLGSGQVKEIHSEADTSFGGLNPEPIAKNLEALQKTVLENKLDIGLSTDGDADRIGAIDENGEFVNSHQIFALLLKHHITHRKLSGKIVKSVSTTQWIDKMCSAYDLDLETTPIGFKHISRVLRESNALMGGEESGGISLREHVHERDGVFNGLLLLEMMAIHQKSLSQLLQELYDEFGRYYFERDDYHLTEDKISQVKAKIFKRDLSEVAGKKIKEWIDIDGSKIVFEDDSWLLVRASGTEPLLRIYAEAHTPDDVQKLLGSMQDYLQISHGV